MLCSEKTGTIARMLAQLCILARDELFAAVTTRTTQQHYLIFFKSFFSLFSSKSKTKKSERKYHLIAIGFKYINVHSTSPKNTEHNQNNIKPDTYKKEHLILPQHPIYIFRNE